MRSQRRISLATLQSKVTKRRDAAKKEEAAKLAAKKEKAKKPKQANVNGVVKNKKDKQKLLGKDAIEMDDMRAEVGAGFKT